MLLSKISNRSHTSLVHCFQSCCWIYNKWPQSEYTWLHSWPACIGAVVHVRGFLWGRQQTLYQANCICESGLHKIDWIIFFLLSTNQTLILIHFPWQHLFGFFFLKVRYFGETLPTYCHSEIPVTPRLAAKLKAGWAKRVGKLGGEGVVFIPPHSHSSPSDTLGFRLWVTHTHQWNGAAQSLL